MKNHDGCTRAFCWTGKAYYAKHMDGSEKNEIMFGMYDLENGGTTGEMAMRWIDLGNRYGMAPQLQSFSDSWSALLLFSDLIHSLSKIDGQDITQEEFVEILLNHGFVDLTQYVNPNN